MGSPLVYIHFCSLLGLLCGCFCFFSATSKDPHATSLEPEASDKDDILLLNEILNASSLDDGEFSREWTAVFGEDPLASLATHSSGGEMETNQPTAASSPSSFLPSQLLDQNMNDLQSSFQGIVLFRIMICFLAIQHSISPVAGN
uniref:Uncharacterized protein n=1 Tax=Sphaerodactylus townsendi TaxID=933632 RepID=A0ACB8FUY3_9SAUR